ncbi:hypothetical protein DFP72DRAFT_1142742 [Ephemerocybe angulata]|uniref:pyranose dehydrogenase (acceptor) n=1 Tax=Ephemerocybe angulata TaxID=980116 RepID=A0A8H6M0Y2_9AGAR|nr:hypothetical protein DFP72DRAFT_1142742 [Tulosesus angulatus]
MALLSWSVSTLSLFLAPLLPAVNAEVYQSLDAFPLNLTRSFDFIIAGGGTAASVLAGRLSENNRFNVLLIEAGNDTASVIELIIPAWATKRNDTEFNWRFVSEPMEGLNNRTIDIPRGRGLGGSSAINAMVYTRGSKDDYDNWGRVTGDRRWGWEALQPYIRRHERWTGATGGRDPTGQYDPKVHGYRGNTQTSLGWYEPSDFDLRVRRNGVLQSEEFPNVLDLNAGKPIGATWIQSTIGNGERCSAARGYLTPSARERPNLTILLNTYITRVLPTPDNVSKKLDIRTVEIAPRYGGTRRALTASKELILSGGVIGTPHILLNSGIGNKTELEALGIPSIRDLPDVGQGITEHVSIAASFTTVPLNQTTIDDATALEMWQQNRTGPLTERFPNHQLLWFRLPKNATLFQTYKDPSTGPTSPQFVWGLDPTASGTLVLLSPYSRGTLKLSSSDPFARPRINYNLLSHPYDLAALKEGIRSLKRYYSGPAWEGYITGFTGPDPDVLSDDQFEQVVRNGAFTTLHPVGSAQMSAKGSKGGVVDPELRVKGVSGLRVIDASVFPYVPAANSQAAVYILTERAVDMIRDRW